MRLRATIVLAAAFLLALPALASPLDDAKQAGHVGEQADGFLGMPPGAPASAQALVDEINAGRGRKYAEIAAKNETSPAAVAALAGKKLIGRAPAGQWVRSAAGKWQQR
ncbi:MAG: YdbL family protein [Deltaproteobacteria bacterium]|nr:YdbL family protein [Deltaproteobacteria bacterium]MBW2418867.1 YdbL family protein [Deltaproteobacteria bacterium]